MSDWAIWRCIEELVKARVALQSRDATRYHAIMNVIASIAAAESKPRDPKAPMAENYVEFGYAR
jgi:hypothetical protein